MQAQLKGECMRTMIVLAALWIAVVQELRGQSPEHYTASGYIVLGEAAARFGPLRAGDTLPEVRVGELPDRVRRSFVKLVPSGAMQRCARVFANERVYIFLLYGPGPRSSEDGESLLLISAENGMNIGPVHAFTPLGFYTAIRPNAVACP